MNQGALTFRDGVMLLVETSIAPTGIVGLILVRASHWQDQPGRISFNKTGHYFNSQIHTYNQIKMAV